LVQRTLSKRIYGLTGLKRMKKTITIIKSIRDAMIFGSWTVGPVMVFLWSVGFISFNF